jgi:hypothetical protein
VRVEPLVGRPAGTTGAAPGVTAGQSTGRARAEAETAAPPVDEARLSPGARLYLTARRAAAAALDERAGQVEALHTRVGSGDYQVPPEALYDAVTAALTQGGEYR